MTMHSVLVAAALAGVLAIACDGAVAMAPRAAVLPVEELAPARGGCSTDADCSLLGACGGGGACVCDAGWTSANCSVLDLAPAPSRARQAYMVNTSSWGGNVVRDPHTGFHHLFYSEMRTGGLHSYNEPGHCQLTTAVSRLSPLGPFAENRTVLRSSAIDGPNRGSISHNVQPQLGPDGAVYIFMITSPPAPAAGLLQKPNTTKPALSVMVGRAPRLGAPFEWVIPKMFDTEGTPVLKDNPTAVVYGNGSVLLFTRGTSLFKADSWRGPYHMLTPALMPCENIDPELSICCKTEDPFVWQSKRGFHLLMHDHEPFAFHKQVLTYAYTEDPSAVSGWHFSYIEAASGTNIPFDDGSVHTLCSRQRPQLFFSETPGDDGVQHGKPLVLFTGAQHGANTDETKLCAHKTDIVNATEYNPYDDYSFTFSQPVN